MSYTLADATLPQLKAALNALTGILAKVKTHAEENSISSTTSSAGSSPRTCSPVLPSLHRLRRRRQVRRPLLRRRTPVYSRDDTNSFPAFEALIAQAKAAVEGADAALIAANADTEVPVNLGPDRKVNMAAKGYAEGYTLPNVYFHLMTTYSIARSKGVPLGKMDYLVPFIGKWVGM
ncbi:unnamed protein product [Parascedosporium putredinis]|uniref:Uncharacterized protein n=1 Tax=Parascedosporium putredinis TaxID=1442378 RepID=A0A9P1MBQ7_9PEZI|nr:unnamed protein product [Parascedosporium putredinis]CAI7996277.1 unnamed protein product [Parascedosporium putredinis]